MKIAAANPLWGAPRIHGELGKLGIEVSERTVSRMTVGTVKKSIELENRVVLLNSDAN